MLPTLYESAKWIRFFPRILVAKKDEEQLLVEIINAASQSLVAECKNEYLRNYFDQLPKALIVALEEVEGHLEAKEREWARLETIPHSVEEISK